MVSSTSTTVIVKQKQLSDQSKKQEEKDKDKKLTALLKEVDKIVRNNKQFIEKCNQKRKLEK
jgi:hypothetical protein